MTTSLARLVFALVLASTGCAVLGAASAPAKSDKPVVLPKFNVSTEVPLIKVGDFHLLEKRFGAAAVVHGGYLYTIGGGRGNLLTNSIERFDLRTGKSEPFGRLKEGRRDHGAALIGNSIYVIGGYTRINTNSGPSASVEVIDLTTGKVTKGPSLPQGRVAFGCVALEGKIFVLGGQLLKSNSVQWSFDPAYGGAHSSAQQTLTIAFTNTVVILDAASGRWSDGSPMPAAGETVGVNVANSSIVVAGGFDGSQLTQSVIKSAEANDQYAALDQIAAYNPRDRIWRIQPSLHRGAYGHSLAFLGHYLFLFGAKDAEDQLIAYDLRGRQSESFTLGYLRSHRNAAVVHEDRIYVIGGQDGNENATDYIQVFQLNEHRTPKTKPSE